MAIAITVTAELKSLNDGKNPNTNNLFSSYSVGDIRLFNQYPNQFYSPTYNRGRLTGGYDKLNDTLIYEDDGFYPVENPVYDTETQYLGSLFFDVNIFKYNILNYTPEQLESIESTRVSETSTSFVEKIITDGENFYKEVLSAIYASYYANEFSPSDVINNQERRALIDFVGNYLRRGVLVGDWEVSQLSLNASPYTTATSVKALSIIEYIVTYVDNYVTTNF